MSETIKDTVISLIIGELKDHFGGGLSGERVIRDTEADAVARKIWEKINFVIAEEACEIPEYRRSTC
jgi:hypothetical protein